jgi:hypothetical protein
VTGTRQIVLRNSLEIKKLAARAAAGSRTRRPAPNLPPPIGIVKKWKVDEYALSHDGEWAAAASISARAKEKLGLEYVFTELLRHELLQLLLKTLFELPHAFSAHAELIA